MRFLGGLFVAALALLLAIPAGALVLGLAAFLDPVVGTWITAGARAGLDLALDDLAAGLPPESLALLVAGLARALLPNSGIISP